MPVYKLTDDACCKLVANFPIDVDSVISVSSKTNTEITKTGNELIVGPTVGTISISAYASKERHVGCIGRASVTIPWLRKYDCDTDTLYFLFAGQGDSFLAGDVDDLAELKVEAVSYRVINASASSGPVTLYEDGMQTDGYGLIYTGDPWSFETETNRTVVIDTGVGDYGRMPLQSFSLQCDSGQLPIANYEFLFQVDNEDFIIHY